MDSAVAKRDWMVRVLGVELPPETDGASRQRPVGRLVAFRQSLLRWREAQQTLEEHLATLGRKVLSHPEVQADPRLKQVQQAVARLGATVPAFGTGLADVLDAGLNATDPAEHARLSGQAVQLIDAYRQKLAAARPLLELERFASAQLGAELPLHGALSAALVDMRRQLAA